MVLCEKGYLSRGATGRSAAGIRHQYGTEVNCRLAVENVKAFEVMQEELDYPFDLEVTLSGYLLITYSQRQFEQFKRNVQLQHKFGIPSEVLSVEELKERFPLLNTEGLVGASFCSRDGHANPWHVTHAYAMAAARGGAKIRKFCEVTDIRVRGERDFLVVTQAGEISTPVVVNAAGADGAVRVAKMVGLDIPIVTERHQGVVTEPVETLMPPMVLCFEDGTWWKQTPHGSYIMGIGDPKDKGSMIDATWQHMQEVAKLVVGHVPVLGYLKAVRQWAGLYDCTPDKQAIVGEVESLPGYYLDVGWSGHGFQFAPSIGRALAELIAGKEPFTSIREFRFERFERGELIPEPVCL